MGQPAERKILRRENEQAKVARDSIHNNRGFFDRIWQLIRNIFIQHFQQISNGKNYSAFFGRLTDIS